MTIGAVNFGSLYLKTGDAVSKYGLSESAAQKLDSNRDGKITANEITKLPSEVNSAIVNYFDNKTHGQFGQSIGFTSENRVTQPTQIASVNPIKNNSLHNAFAVNHNNGELSPVVADGVRGNVLPRLYA